MNGKFCPQLKEGTKREEEEDSTSLAPSSIQLPVRRALAASFARHCQSGNKIKECKKKENNTKYR